MKTFGWEPTEEELKDMVNVIDQDGDGDINFNEFVWLMTRWKDFIFTCPSQSIFVQTGNLVHFPKTFFFSTC